ncbi:hypothetical protein L9F63_007379, partial [Diploptera punctata]
MKKISKDKRDIYYRLAKEEGWRARSAFKLIQIDDQYDILKEAPGAIDLCAAPGSWSQVLLKKIRSNTEIDQTKVKIVAVDLQAMAPLPGLIQIVGDITKVETAHALIDHFKDDPCQLVVCDGAPDVTGLHDIDEFVQAQLLIAAFNIASYVLTTGGTFVAKIFRGKDVSLLISQLDLFFDDVYITKPRSSRSSSIESFVVCKKFRILPGYEPTIYNPLLNHSNEEHKEFTGTNKYVSPFLASGDLRPFDVERICDLKIDNPRSFEFFGRLYQFPLLRVYRKHDRSLQ